MIQVTLLVPLVYLKNFLAIIRAESPSQIKLFYVTGWLFVGLFITIFLAFRDVLYYIQILSMHRGCREAFGLEDEL